MREMAWMRWNYVGVQMNPEIPPHFPFGDALSVPLPTRPEEWEQSQIGN